MKTISIEDVRKNAYCNNVVTSYKDYPMKDISVCWECFKEAHNAGVNIHWLHNYLDEADYDAYMKETRTEKVDDSAFFPKTKRIISDKGFQILEKAFLKKKDFRDLDY